MKPDSGQINGKKGGLKAVPARFCPVIGILRAVPLSLAFVVLSYGEEINVKEKVSRLNDKNPAKRVEAISDLGKSGERDAKKALMAEFKKEKNPYVKTRIIEALGKRQDRTSTMEIVNIAQTDAGEDSRNAAVRALGYAKDESVVPVLIERFQDEKEKPGVRLQAADSLTNYPTDGAFGVFVKALDDADLHIKRQALVSLYNGFGWDKTRVLPHIEKMAKDKDTETIANQYLKNLGVKK